jgi:hypothetical protein
MRPRTLAVLFALVLGLGAFIWFYERELPSTEERAVQEKKVFGSLEAKDVLGLTLDRAGTKVRFERVEPAKAEKEEDKKDDENDADASLDPAGEDDEDAGPPAEWRLAEPLAARADGAAVNALLESLLALEKSRTLDAVDRKVSGLDKPEAAIAVKTASGEKILELGAVVPPGGSRLAAFRGEKEGYVVSDAILTEVQKAPGDWRDRRIVPGDRETVARVVLRAPGNTVVLAKKDGVFRLESPLADAARREPVDDLLFNLTGLSAERFVDAPPAAAEMGLAPPQAVVEATVAGQPLRLEIGKETGAAPEPAPPDPSGAPPAPPETSYYVRVGNQVYEAKVGALLAAAARPAAEWRSLSLSGFEVHEIESATVRTAKGKVDLTRKDTDWKRGDTLIAYMPVSDFFLAVTGGKAERLVTAAEAQAMGANLTKPTFEVALKVKKGQETLRFYPRLAGPAPLVPVQVSGRDAVLLLPAAAMGEVTQKWEAVEKAEPLEKAKES